MKLPLTIGAKVASAIYDADGVPVCLIDSMQEASRGDEQEMARRIVACVNACEGFTTGSVEDCGRIGGLKKLDRTVVEQTEVLMSLKRQRDELLAALEHAHQTIGNLPPPVFTDGSGKKHLVGDSVPLMNLMARMQSAIAKAKGAA